MTQLLRSAQVELKVGLVSGPAERFYPTSVSVEDFDTCVSNTVAIRPKDLGVFPDFQTNYYTWAHVDADTGALTLVGAVVEVEPRLSRLNPGCLG